MTSTLFLLMTVMLVAESSADREIRLIVSSRPEEPSLLASHLFHQQNFIKKGTSSSSNDILTLLDKLAGGNKRIAEACSCSCRPNYENRGAFEEKHNEFSPRIFDWRKNDEANSRIFDWRKNDEANSRIFDWRKNDEANSRIYDWRKNDEANSRTFALRTEPFIFTAA